MVYAGRRLSSPKLHIEPEEDDVPILHNILLTLAADETLFLRGGHTAAGHQLVGGDDLRPDEATLKIGVDFSGSLRCFGTLRDGPGAHFRLAGPSGRKSVPAGNSIWRSADPDPTGSSPSSDRNTAFSSGSIPAISASSSAQMGRVSAPSALAMAWTAAYRRFVQYRR